MAKLVGEYLRDMTSITSNQIVVALRNQVVLKDEGRKRLLGELLLEAGHITEDQLDEALRQQRQGGRTIIEPHSFDRFFDFQVH